MIASAIVVVFSKGVVSMSPEAVYYIANLILYMFWALSVNILCQPRFPRWLTLLLELISAVGFELLLLSLELFSMARLLAGIAYFIAVMLLLHCGNRFYVGLISLMIIVTMTVAEMIYMGVMPREAALSGELFEQNAVLVYAGYLFLNAVMLSIVVTLIRVLIKRHENDRLSRVWLLLPVFPICQFATVVVLYNAYIQVGSISNKILWLILIYAASDIVLFLAFRTASRNRELRMRNAFLEEQIDSQVNHYRQLAGSYDSIRKLRHDIDNHLYTIQALLDEGQVQEASAYNRQLISRDDARLPFNGCRNSVAAAYLEKKAADLEKAGIRFETDIQLPENLRIADPDLICVLGNILDNAAEACQNQKDAQISLRAEYRAPYVNISCRNPLPDEARTARSDKKRRIPELERGIGFTILQSMAERYAGDFHSESDQDSFLVRVVLKEADSK